MPANSQWILRRRPTGEIKPGDLELVERPTPPLRARFESLSSVAVLCGSSHEYAD